MKKLIISEGLVPVGLVDQGTGQFAHLACMDERLPIVAVGGDEHMCVACDEAILPVEPGAAGLDEFVIEVVSS